MSDNDWLTAVFEEHRDHLRGVAYRLLGSMSDADDAVQDTWLRLTSADTSEVQNLGGWLTTVVARVSLNILRTRQRRREDPVGDVWPAPADQRGGEPGTSPEGAPEDEAVLADSVGLALIVVLDTLTPGERLAFVLHDLFAMPFPEVAAVLGRSLEATRQLPSRARRRVRGAPSPDRAADLSRQREVVSAFLAASRGGDLSTLVGLLDTDVTLTADEFTVPGGKAMRLQGVPQVSKGALLASARSRQSQVALVDGNVGIVFAPAGRLQVVLTMAVSEARTITAIDVIADPERLRRLRLAILPE